MDGRSDIYALGIVFYEMLTAQLPFKAESRVESMAQRISGRVRDINESGVKVPSWVRDVLRRCLERSPERRYQSGREVVADLDRRAAATGLSRGRLAAAAAAAVLLAGAGWAAWLYTSRPAASPRPSEKARPPAAATSRDADPRHAIAVLPLSDETGDATLSWAGAGLAEMVSTGLSEEPALRVLDVQRVRRTLRDLKLEGGRYDEPALRRLAGVLEVDRIVAGAVRRDGERVRVEVRLVWLGPAGTLSTHNASAEASGSGGLFEVAGRLAADLGRQLGASRPAAADAGTSPIRIAFLPSRYQTRGSLRSSSATALSVDVEPPTSPRLAWAAARSSCASTSFG